MRAASDGRAANSAAAEGGTPRGGVPVAPARGLGPRRRRPALIALSVALIAAGGLGSAAFYVAGDSRVQVLAVAQDVPMGQTVQASDLRTVAITLDPGISPVRARDRGTVVGRRAAVDLHAGSLLTASQVTDQVTVQPGQMLVGVAVAPDHMPAEPLQPGTQVLLVSTPRKGDDPPTSPPQSIPATVVRPGVVDKTSGNVVLDVAVAPTDGVALAARSFTERIEVVVLVGASPGGGS